MFVDEVGGRSPAGDPHSPWRYGTGVLALAKGLLYAHCGWLLNREITNKSRLRGSSHAVL